MIDVVCATRQAESEFWARAPLGLSLRRLARDGRLVPRLAFANQRGLPDVYNARITAADRSEMIVFVHDDVWIDDYFLADRVVEGLRHYDVIGVAGNRRRAPGQPSWAFLDTDFTWDERANLTGFVAHGKPFGPVQFFGAVPAECELLDGVFMAARPAALADHQVFFDQRFDFHFYDMDFCRRARQRGLRLGTWPICLTHQSPGAFGTPPWEAKYRTYLEKWGD